MEENNFGQFYDAPEERVEEPQVFVPDTSAKPIRRVCVFVSQDDRNASISKD